MVNSQQPHPHLGPWLSNELTGGTLSPEVGIHVGEDLL